LLTLSDDKKRVTAASGLWMDARGVVPFPM